ncbi:hypothetical protein [Streptomyces winkii]|uniref:hypothetical protein n=1 Tax=Streptomyces winkii TaxID=3051178 RepID=UPI0028D81FC1|nr:hypothetical protein [Streptomyces sp. DSM 40971]
MRGTVAVRPLYPDGATLRDKIEAVATRVYGADGVDYTIDLDENNDIVGLS